jgi:hypothetical protein
MYAELQELSQLADELQDKLDATEAKTETVSISVARLAITARGLLTILQRIGLPEEAEEVVRLVQRMIGVMMQFQVVAAATMGPYGWIFGAIGVVGIGTSLMDGLREY